MPSKKLDRTLNFWQLGCILGSALGLPAMLIGDKLSKSYGAGTALTSILIGNFLLWMIGLGIISMSHGKNNTIDNVKGYLGKGASIVASLVLIFAFIIWYAIQTQGGAVAVSAFFPTANLKAIGITLGLFVALLSMGGIRIIKIFCILGLPFSICFTIYGMTTSTQNISFPNTWGFSFSGIVLIILTSLPGVVNLPTFFRHSQSRANSILALSIMVFLHSIFQIFAIEGVMSYSLTPHPNIAIYTFFTPVFILISFISANLINIYVASAGWETIFVKHKGFKNYFTAGVLGTIVYLFLPNFSILNVIETIASSFIVSLGVVLLIDFLIKIVISHRKRPLEKLWSNISWLIACSAAVVTQVQGPSNSNKPVIISIYASLLVFLLIIFVEETAWSIKRAKKFYA